jgi:MYXO-CTERM domain-containing protein
MWDGLLDQGHRIAAIGGSDDHTAGQNEGPTGSPVGSPTTRVLADNLGEAAIIDAIRRGRTIVQLRGPDDPVVDVTMKTAAGASVELGNDVDELDGIDHVRVALHVTGGSGTFAQLWRNGAQVGGNLAITGDDVTTELDDVPGAGEFRYRVELVESAGRRVVVTSHFYVRAAAPGAGCGCRTGAPDASWLLALALPWLCRRRRPRSSRFADPSLR